MHLVNSARWAHTYVHTHETKKNKTVKVTDMNLKTNINASNVKGALLLKAMLVLLVVAAFGSCKTDEVDTSVLSSDCYISSVSLGQLKRAIYYGENNDSVGYVSFSAATLPITVDQRTGTIENYIPLPYGSVVTAVLMNISHTGSLIYRYQGDDEPYLYSSKDSIDCSRPVTFTVYSSDGLSKRNYTFKLNVEKEDGSKFKWTKVEESAYLNNDTVRRLVVGVDSAMLMLGCKADGTMTRYRRTRADEAWSMDPVQYAGINGTSDLDLQTLTLSPAKDKLLMSTIDGSKLLESVDGITWTDKEDLEGKRLIGATNSRIYALADSLLYSKADGEELWKLEVTDAQKDFTPLYDVRMMVMEQAGYTRLVMTGYNKTGEEKTDDAKPEEKSAETINAVVWLKSWRTADDDNVQKEIEARSTWMSYPHESINHWMLPKMQPLFTFPYTDGIVAFGGKTASLPALSTMLYSPDFGLTWKTNGELLLHSKMSGAEGPLAAAVDYDNFIWVVTGAETWCGRLNRLNN